MALKRRSAALWSRDGVTKFQNNVKWENGHMQKELTIQKEFQ